MIIKENDMPTLNQEIVVNRIKQKVGKGLISVGKEMRGIYKESIVKNPSKLTRSKGYKELMKPVVEQMEEERQRAIALLKKKISKAKYRDLTDGIDKLTKNIQLLNGGKTSNDSIKISWED